LEGIFARSGVEIARSTMCAWMLAMAILVKPLYELMAGRVRQSVVIHTDDTRVPVQAEGKCKSGRIWTYIGDELHPYVVYEYTPDRTRAGPATWLKDYQGYLQADAYGGYDGIYATGVIEVACWAHARRKFFDAQGSDPARAAEMLVLIGDLYEIEARAKEENLERDQIQARRQKESRPILEGIEKRLVMWGPQVLPKSPLGQAIGYAQGQWLALNRYLDDGVLDIDNNLAERTLRMVAIGRKNWLFVGHDNGGHRAAIIYSLVASCKLCGIDPFAYLRDVLERISTHPASRIAELLPRNWKPSRP
jgi:hypothetical protein